LRKAGKAMKIESTSTVSVDPVRIESTGVVSVAISQASTNRDNGVEQPRKVLQKETRSAEEIHKDLEMINEQLKSSNSSIQFSVDDKSNDVIVRIVDRDSGEVIRQIPPESIVRLRDSMKDMSGLFIEKKI
jgi:flagellar protein FlaG